jgi:hypothetical protein
MPLSMALAGTVGGAIGLTTTFLLAGLLPPVLAAVAIVAARLPADEIAHPLDAGSGEPEPALLGWSRLDDDGLVEAADAGIVPAREGEPWPS